ncbi:hypothetical protein IQ07DRAFT_585374 [Pyrenochaeta sp. DS3sAY3a]|nr:hypothetical protein IQ07DRAFT_585374 [Pyrenochaeta sp. DS3sAY3a]
MGPDGSSTTRAKVLSRNKRAKINYISFDAATDLGQEVRPITEEPASQQTRTFREDIKGCVDLDWRFANSKEEWRTTSFYVTTTNDPPYDAVLGREEAKQCGMGKSTRFYNRALG